jgi:tRNA threonylcarbamoyladenosine biosynthesis protein TsaB
VSGIRILHIETATASCSVAIAENGILCASRAVNDGLKHAENLMRLIREVLEEAGWNHADLNAVAVSAGPGSYTGLRIGVSAAKGLCYATDVPLIAVSTLFTLASGFVKRYPEAGAHLCPMIDARRMEVYTALYTRDLHGLRPDHPLVVLGIESIPELNEQVIAFFGDGAEKCKDLLGLHPNARFSYSVELSAADMITSAYESYKLGSFADLAYFEPEYLKPYHGTPPQLKPAF